MMQVLSQICYNNHFYMVLLMSAICFFYCHAAIDGLCLNGVHNYVTGDSNKSHEMMIRNLSGLIYNTDGKKPACNNERPTVIMPGVAKILEGELMVPRKYDLIKSGLIKMTIRNPSFDEPLCFNGKSNLVALPSYFCSFELCPFIGNDLCEFLSAPGVHTIKEMEEKLKFNSTLVLPEPPSILGISLLDILAGEFSFGFALEHEGKVILELQIPSNEKYLQIGVITVKSDDDD